MTSTGTRNCRGQKPDPVLICCRPKPELPGSGYFQGIIPWKTPQESSQPLWSETPEVMGGGAGRLRNQGL